MKRLINKIFVELTCNFNWINFFKTFCYSMFGMLIMAVVVLFFMGRFTELVTCGFVSIIFVSLGAAFEQDEEDEEDYFD